MRFLPRFQLRTLLVGLAVAAVLLAYFASQWRSRERQYEAAARLSKVGVRAFARGSGSRTPVGREPAEWWSTIWHLRPPIDYVEIDEYLGIRSDGATWEAVRRPAGEKLSAAQLAELAALRDLKRLHLQGDVVEPAVLGEFAKLTSLEQLTIAHNPIDDKQLQQFASLKHLRELALEATQTTEQGVEKLRDAIPGLEVYDD